MADRESEYKKLRSYLSRAIRGPNTDAILRSVASGPAHLVNNVEAVNDSLYIVTAREKYLDQRLGNKGVVRPSEVGLSDEVFREIGIEITNRTQLRDLIHQLLRVLYGEIFTRATSTSQEAEDFELEDGDNLIISFDNKEPVEIAFNAGQFQNISEATAQEVADAITKSLRRIGSTGSAFVIEDGGDIKVALLSSTDGPSSTVKVLGGKAQNSLKFDEIRNTSNDLTTQWTLTQQPGGTMRATWTGGSDPSLGRVKIGDYVNMYGSTFDPANRGTFDVVEVQGGTLGNAYVEYENPNGVPETVIEGGIAPILNETFFAGFEGSTTADRGDGTLIPDVDENSTLNAGAVELYDTFGSIPYSTLEYDSQDNIDLSGPTEIQFVATFDYTGLPSDQNNIISVGNSSSLALNQVQMRHRTNGDLEFFILDDTNNKVYIARSFSPIAGQKYHFTLTMDPATGGDLYIDGTSTGNIYVLNSAYNIDTAQVERITISGLSDTAPRWGSAAYDWVQIKNSIDTTADFTPIYSDPQQPSAGESNAMLFFNPKNSLLTSKERYAAAFQTSPRTLELFVPATTKIVRRNRAGAAHIYESGPSNVGQEGPYLYDTEQGYVLGVESALTTEKLDTSSDSILFIDDASDFPDSDGNIIIGYGTSHQEGPVPYISKPSEQTLRINPSYKFKNEHPIGTDVSLIAENNPANPNKDGTDYPFFLTDSVAGRIYTEDLMQEITATGIVLIIYVLYPDDVGLGKAGDPVNSEKYYIWGTEEDI